MPLQWWKESLSHSHLQRCLASFFLLLIQNLALGINFEFPAMASPRQVTCLILVRIHLQAHERASGRSQSGGSHNSDIDRLANRARVASGPAASKHCAALACGSGCRSETVISLIQTVSADV